uniref:G-protein coupled receptors family 1 profile domain-containing protein n=1 Tax=Ditylenchus dipsaci TaxID=166011 RepID=A0A915ESK3_9BILA
MENITTAFSLLQPIPSSSPLLANSNSVGMDMITDLETTTITVQSNNGVPERNFTDTLEILIYTICLCVGGPLNLLSFRKLLSNFNKRGGKISSSKSGAQITLLKLNLNVADLITMFVYTLSQIIWMITYQWYAGDLLSFGFYLNSFVVACFAIDRAVGTRHLNTINATQDAYLRVRRMLFCAWIFAFILSLPQSFIFRVVEPPGMVDFKQCTPVWTIIGFEIDLKISSLAATGQLTETERWRLIQEFQNVLNWERIYNIAHLLFVFWIPTLVIITSYASILCILSSFSVPKRIRANVSFRNANRLSLTTTTQSSTKPLFNGEKQMEPRFTSMDRSHNGNMTNEQKSCSPEDQSPADFSEEKNDFFQSNGHVEGPNGIIRVKSSSLKTQRKQSHAFLESKNSFEKWGKRISLCSLSLTPNRPLVVDADPGLGDKPKSNGREHRSIGSATLVGPIAMQTILKARQKTKRQAALILLNSSETTQDCLKAKNNWFSGVGIE